MYLYVLYVLYHFSYYFFGYITQIHLAFRSFPTRASEVFYDTYINENHYLLLARDLRKSLEQKYGNPILTILNNNNTVIL